MGRAHAVLPEEGLFKRKHHVEFIEKIGHGSRTPTAPCPRLRGDVVGSADTCAFCIGGQTQVKARIVDGQKQSISTTLLQQFGASVQKRSEVPVSLGHFPEAGHGQLVESGQGA